MGGGHSDGEERQPGGCWERKKGRVWLLMEREGGGVEVTRASGWWPGAWGPLPDGGWGSGREGMRSVWTVEVEFPERCPGGESSKIWVEKGLALMG